MNLESCLTRLAQLIGAENKQIDQRLSALERRFDLVALPRADASLPEGADAGMDESEKRKVRRHQ